MRKRGQVPSSQHKGSNAEAIEERHQPHDNETESDDSQLIVIEEHYFRFRCSLQSCLHVGRTALSIMSSSPCPAWEAASAFNTSTQ